MNRYPLVAGHRACAGCGEALGARLALDAVGGPMIVTTATGCLEVFSTPYPYSAWTVPWIHSLFENAPAVASGIRAALRAQGREDVTVVAQGGDGALADIGFGSLSGALDRGEDLLLLLYDNEAYMNTGVQRSGLTPFAAHTSTSPSSARVPGNLTGKKPLALIAAAHGASYVATASVGYPQDLQKKVRRAKELHGPRLIQLHVPCPLGWRHEAHLTLKVAQLAVQTGLYPLFEMERGEIVRVKRISRPQPVEDYLRLQGRFGHLFPGPEAPEETHRLAAAALERIREIARDNVRRYQPSAAGADR